MADWTTEDVEVLKRAYPSAPWPVLLRVLPNRTKRAVWNKAHKLDLSRYLPPTQVARAAWRESVRRRKPRLGKFLHPVVEREGVPGKVCCACSDWKPLEKFARHKDCAGGRRAMCMTCGGRWAYANHREAVIATVRRYQKRHPEAHKLRKRAGDRRRHKRKIDGAGVPVAVLRALLKQHDNNCVYCGAPADTIDHMVPLSRGGKHEIDNIVPACRSCNFAKHTKTYEEFVSMRNER